MGEIRNATLEDLAEIVAIYNASIPSRIATGDLQQISIESRLNWFKERVHERYPIWVMERDKKVIGWLSLQHFYGRPAYKNTAEISLYISPNYQRQGIGKKLLEYAIEQSPKLGLTTLLGFIFAHNQPSLTLFQKHDFQQWGYLPKVAQLDGEIKDLVIMGRNLAK
ncbi:GNAT family N-acetyltransferase [Crocosphaera sp. UHCC 0190]|uniref:GNAT family N-acetyltransferase n=1 Tax=Crocosphaera sp. UHCC 0190 TaxID=3110246 RepID=UPI002B1FC2DE|nr:GNAT family N-acetyltransferase [Crocosphaera sp. UHCC 0190]MEA5510908.1 GNAT family N-acetyltransferase [Crocosphaera sp. UHCC 0190]